MNFGHRGLTTSFFISSPNVANIDDGDQCQNNESRYNDGGKLRTIAKSAPGA